MSIEMSLDGCIEIVDSLYEIFPLEINKSILWNGRKVGHLKKQQDRQEIFKKMQVAEESSTFLQNVEIKTLSLQKSLEEDDPEFNLNPSFERMTQEATKGLRKVEKSIEETAKKLSLLGKKSIEKVVNFIKSHKTECWIVEGVLLGASFGITAIKTILGIGGPQKKEELATNPFILSSPLEVFLDQPVLEIAPKNICSGFFQNAFSILIEAFRRGVEFTGSGLSESDIFDSKSSVFFSNHYISNKTRTSFFEFLQQALHAGFEVMGHRLNTNSQDSHSFNSLLMCLYNAFNSFTKALGGISTLVNNSLAASKVGTNPSGPIPFKTEGDQCEDRMITFINGMGNSFEDAQLNMSHLKELNPSSLCIEGIYNHSNRIGFDTIEAAAFNLAGYSPSTQKLLMQQWTEFHEKNKSNPAAKILHFCHSQGAIHTRNALVDLPKEICQHIIVIAIAPAVIVPKELCCDSFNYASKKDYVPYVERLYIYTMAAFNDENERRELLKYYSRVQSQLVWLDPHENSTLFDHEFMSPTYVSKINDHLLSYFIQNGEYSID